MSHSLFILTVNDVSCVMSCLKIKHVTVFRAKSNYIVTLKILPTVVSVITQRKKTLALELMRISLFKFYN